MDEMSLGGESDAEPMSKDMFEDICDESQSHSIINMREVRYKIRGRIKQRRSEWKGALLSMKNISKFLYKVFKSGINEISQNIANFG